MLVKICAQCVDIRCVCIRGAHESFPVAKIACKQWSREKACFRSAHTAGYFFTLCICVLFIGFIIIIIIAVESSGATEAHIIIGHRDGTLLDAAQSTGNSHTEKLRMSRLGQHWLGFFISRTGKTTYNYLFKAVPKLKLFSTRIHKMGSSFKGGMIITVRLLLYENKIPHKSKRTKNVLLWKFRKN